MRYAKPDALLLAAALALPLPAGAQTADTQTAAEPAAITWPLVIWDPGQVEADEEMAGDLVLPMPCGGAMVFRPVDVPGGAIMSDRKIVLGNADPQRGYIENSREAFLSGTFHEDDAWRYYIGKYEVTNVQFEALMGLPTDTCPDIDTDDAGMPQVAVTPGEAFLTVERFTEWLYANAPDTLPGDDDIKGFIRLPTETEWEYAARGGDAVGPAAFEGRLPPMDGPEEDYINYFRPGEAFLDFPGLRLPNQLGLYDMIGNAWEMVDGLFQLSHVGRALGRTGGYIRRGGSYRNRLQELHSGYRDEYAPVARDGLVRDETTGFRLAIAAPVLPSGKDLEQIRDDWQKLAQTETLSLGDEKEDPREEVQTLAEFTSQLDFDQKDEMERRILRLGDTIDVSIAKQKAERARAAAEMLRAAIFFSLRLPGHYNSIGRCEKLMESDADKWRERCDQVQADKDFDIGVYHDHLTTMKSEFQPNSIILEQVEGLTNQLEQRKLKNSLVSLPKVLRNFESVVNLGEAARPEIESTWN